MPALAPPRLVCVRCGRLPRMVIDGESAYICQRCHDDPETDREVRAGLVVQGERAARRAMVDRFGWHGGWDARG